MRGPEYLLRSPSTRRRPTVPGGDHCNQCLVGQSESMGTAERNHKYRYLEGTISPMEMGTLLSGGQKERSIPSK